jgi:hypothetical protein
MIFAVSSGRLRSRLARGGWGRRPGALMTAELLLTLPTVLALIAGLLAVCQLLLARQALATASSEGARIGAIGGDASSIQLAVQRTLVGAGPLVQADVNVQFFEADGGRAGPLRYVIVVVSAPVGLALIGAPHSALSGLGDQRIAAITIMRVE